MRTRILTLLACGLVLARVDTATAQGLFWENQTTGVGDHTRTAQVYAMPKMMKIVQEGGGVVIIRGDQDKFYSLDPVNKTYTELTLAQMAASAKAVQSQMKTAMEKMQKQMKDMPPEQRAKMEQMMQQMDGIDGENESPVEVKSTGETKTIGGHKCSQYVATSGGKTIVVAWTANDIKGFASLREDWLAYQKRMLESSRGAGREIAAAYAKIEGFPMEMTMGALKTVVTKVEPRNTPLSEFEVPASYQKRKLEAIQGD